MKIWFLVFFLFATVAQGFAQVVQKEQTVAEKTKAIPAFELTTVNKTVFTKAKLKKNTPLIIIFFSPTCEHCIHQMDAMVKRIKDFNNFQIVMGTFQPVEELADFNKKYKIASKPNFITGRDEKYILPPYFQIETFPFMAFYDKNGVLLSTHQGNISVDDMLKRMKGAKT